MHRRLVSLCLALAVTTAGCTDGNSKGAGAATTVPAPAATDAIPAATSTITSTVTTAAADTNRDQSLACDPLDDRACLLPWPNDAFTVADDATVTGRRLDIRLDSTPSNAQSVPIDPTDQNRADGFSPGSAVLTLVPGLSIEASGIAPSTDIGASLDPEAPIVLLDVTSGERVPYWGELDATAPSGDQLLIVHPATSLGEGHHIVVGLREMKDASGATIPRSPAFQAALDDQSANSGPLLQVIAALAANGVSDDGLYLAWEFTVASAKSLSGRLLHIRDEAYASLGNAAPAFTVTDQSDSGNARTINGTYEVPNFLTGDGAPGSTFILGDDGLPMHNEETPIYTAPFRCVMPIAAAGPVPAIVYGHGLLGSRGEVDALGFAAQLGTAGACATDEIGMSSGDIGNLAAILGDLSNFDQQADRMQQGLLNQQFLGRLLNHPDGFVSSPAFQTAAGSPLIAVGATQFVGNSQGGVLGGAASAISTEWNRVVLGVPGINYSLLLPRSSDWPQFQSLFDVAYTDPADRLIALQLIQLLWDRGENDGYAQHLTDDPYAGIAPKQVLLVQAFGDHQVANVSTDVLARTIGATVHEPAIGDGRSNDVDPQWGITPFDATAPSNGILVLWDFGTPAPPPVNLPPTEPEYGADPHGAGSQEPLVLQQALTFLLTGQFDDVCNGAPCTSRVLTG